MKQFEHLLRETIGLDVQSIGPTSIQRAVRLRMRSLGLKSPEDYQQLVERSRAEWNALVESVIVPETWFFRDPALFSAFAHLVLAEWLPAHPAVPVRVLSIPCASGEEPYSLVMALLDAGVAPERFQIHAVDISARALACAESGLYGNNSFRGKDLAFRDRYFQPSGEGFVLAAAVRSCVRFYRGNLFSDDFRPKLASYNFIFCRNLLIYFDRPTQQKAIETIERLLAPFGVLFVGPVEQPLVLSHGLVSANIPAASACRKAAHVVRRPRLARIIKQPSVPAAPQPNGALQPHLAASSGLNLPTAARPLPSVRHDLETARRLADAGRLHEAAEICEAHLRQSRGSAQAYYLLGLVRDASGDARAIECYRKALYLDPNHYESLLQMALLLQKNGDPSRARAFTNRAQRIIAKG
jgi:chemotaxis protein methyltransferase WspC